MATRSSVLAWRIPGTGEPGGLPSMGSHRVGHDWSDLAAAAAAFCEHHLILLDTFPPTFLTLNLCALQACKRGKCFMTLWPCHVISLLSCFVITEYLRLGGLNSKPVYLTVSETEIWGQRASMVGFLGEGPLPGLQTTIFSLCFHMAENREGNQVLLSLFMWAPIPLCGFHTHDLIIS